MDAQTWSEDFFKGLKSASEVSSRLTDIFSSSSGSPADSKEKSILEFVASSLTGRLDSSISIDALKSLLTVTYIGPDFDLQRKEVTSLLENSLWFWSTQTSFDVSAPSDQWKKLAVLTSKLFSCDFFDAASAKLVLPTDLLIYSLNLPDKDEDLTRKFVKIR